MPLQLLIGGHVQAVVCARSLDWRWSLFAGERLAQITVHANNMYASLRAEANNKLQHGHRTSCRKSQPVDVQGPARIVALIGRVIGDASAAGANDRAML